MAMSAADECNEPATLHRVMQTMIAEGMQTHFQPQRELSHELFVLLLQLKEEERKRELRGFTRRRSAAERTYRKSGRRLSEKDRDLIQSDRITV